MEDERERRFADRLNAQTASPPLCHLQCTSALNSVDEWEMSSKLLLRFCRRRCELHSTAVLARGFIHCGLVLRQVGSRRRFGERQCVI